MIRTLLRDPLAHFLIAGAAIWGVLALAGDPVDPAERTITLSREQQAALALQFERTMRRPPTDAELDAQIEQWVREEVLYREALRLGLDESDTVVRRRMANKMDELAGAEAEMARPSNEALEAWYRENGARFETGGALDFEQAFFRTRIEAEAARGSEPPRGQPISLPRHVSTMSMDEVAGTFGEVFAGEMDRLRAGPEWQGPIQSGYGWHLVRLQAREEGSVPPLDTVRDRAEAEWRSATMQARREQAYRILREAYTVEIE